MNLDAEVIGFLNKYKYVVYTVYNANNEVMYIGKSKTFKARWYQHTRESAFYKEAARVVLSAYETESEILFAESQYIVHFQPKYNALGKGEKMSRFRIAPITKLELFVVQ